MTFDYNGKTYTVTDSSTYFDITVEVDTLDDACTIVNEFEGMTNYTFSKRDYTDMVVTKRTITIGGNIFVNVKLRKKTQVETMQEEIINLRTSLEELALSTNKTTTAKINKILAGPTITQGVIE